MAPWRVLETLPVALPWSLCPPLGIHRAMPFIPVPHSACAVVPILVSVKSNSSAQHLLPPAVISLKVVPQAPAELLLRALPLQRGFCWCHPHCPGGLSLPTFQAPLRSFSQLPAPEDLCPAAGSGANPELTTLPEHMSAQRGIQFIYEADCLPPVLGALGQDPV